MKNSRSVKINSIREKFLAIKSSLNERSLRLWAASEAKAIGRGGPTYVREATGISKTTIYVGLKELDEFPQRLDGEEEKRIRKKGGGRKKIAEKQEGLLQDLEALIEPTAKENPETPLSWTSKSCRKIAEALRKKGHKVSYRTVCNLLKDLGYSLQANKKSLEGSSHKDRDEQFNYINKSVAAQHEKNQPTISVDTKKKENVGHFKNDKKELCKKGTPEKVNTHDFPDERLGKVVPYGVYDIGKNEGWVSIGISADTAEFAVNTIRTWWCKLGIKSYPQATELLVTADCGGSNGYRVKLWKAELQKFSDETGLKLIIRHFPPGTSKWNKIEHRLFSYVSKNWRGKPLLTQETVVNLISHTTTNTELKVYSVLDENEYDVGRVVSKEELASLNQTGDIFHPEWNYTISPRNSL